MAAVQDVGIKQVAVVMVGVSDLARSARFYEHTLGLKRKHGSPEFVFLDGGGITLGLSTGLAKSIQPLVGAVEIVFAVDDVRRSYEALKAAGVEFIREPRRATEQEWVANFRDPDGHLLSLFGPSSETAPVGG